jgi:hypothetical protein
MTAIWDMFAWFAAAAPRDEGGAGLVNCPDCRKEAVIPVDWEDGGDKWHIALRCGNCGARREVTLDDGEARKLDRALDRGIHQIRRALTALERRRMRTEADTLSVALERDLIGADDFARRPLAR